jgi:hypothetical protein
MIYFHQWVVDEAGANLLGVARRIWARKGYDREAELLDVKPAPEAHAARSYYPLSAVHRPGNSVPYRATYRLVETEI